MNKVTENIKIWAVERDLHKADPNKQMLKLIEEIGELSSAMVRSDEWEISDGLGDIYVVLTILAMQLGYDLENCIEEAYEEIKDRQGEMVNGVFVKDEDLPIRPEVSE